MKKRTAIVVAGVSRKQIMNALNSFERLRNTYFWRPAGSASGRRSEEARNSFRLPEFKYDNNTVSVSCIVLLP